MPPASSTSGVVTSRGFTLVEILVVVGIIALLLAILFPTLAKARQQSERLRCATNLHQLDLALRTYGANFRGCVPIGYSASKQISYFIYIDTGVRNSEGTYGQVTQFGLLWDAGLLKSARTYFCPSYKGSPMFQYQTDLNQFPFYSGTPTVSNNTIYQNSRMGYNARPVVDWPSYGPPFIPSDMPTFPRLGNKAIVADLIFDPSVLILTHKMGINVLYGNGSVKWIDMRSLMATKGKTKGYSPAASWFTISPPTDLRTIDNLQPYYNTYMLDESVNPPMDIWVWLDLQ